MQIKTHSVLKKGGFTAAFFLRLFLLFWLVSICLVPQSAFSARTETIKEIVVAAQTARLAEKPMWASLLHVANGIANIRDEDFLLSQPNFSLEQELVATIHFLYNENTSNVCRFPARYLWLRSEVTAPALAIEACAELNEFKLRAPADEITLVFASENLAQPSSMMGHILIKLSGDNDKKNRVDHAVSFITDAGGMNLPKLFFDSMVIGKKGFFTLSPYDEKLELYLRGEQRSIWEYTLRFDAAKRALIQAHLMELKQTKLTYFFQKYNCATVVDFIVSVGAGKQLPVTGFWLTPKDVVKRADELGLILQSRVVPPNRWLIRAISEQLLPAERDEIKHHVDRLAALPNDSQNLNTEFIRYQLAKSYHAYRVETKQITGAQSQAYSGFLDRLFQEKFKDMRLETSSFKNPIDTPQDSQVELGVLHRDGNNYLRIGLTPASHHLTDDNRQYFGESELLLLDISVLKNISTRQIELDRFTLYGAKSLIPRDDMSGGLSGAIRLGIEPQRDANFQRRKAAFLSGSLGVTKRFWGDVDLFALAGFGVAYRSSELNLYTQPELGIIVRELFEMKSSASAVMTVNAFGDRSKYVTYRFVQSKFFPKQNISLLFTAESEKQHHRRRDLFEIGVKYLF